MISIFERYGFRESAIKTTKNGTELVLVKEILRHEGGLLERYPLVKLRGHSIYLLSLYPEWHTRLLPDSILHNEDASIVQDVSHTNSIHKVYLAGMRDMQNLQPGDVILIYRTGDGQGPAYYRSVATSVCVLEEYRSILSFASQDEFMKYCAPYSVFTRDELDTFWRTKRYRHVLRFAYNIALPKRVTRRDMIEDMGFDANAYWGFMELSNEELLAVLQAGEVNENLIVD